MKLRSLCPPIIRKWVKRKMYPDSKNSSSRNLDSTKQDLNLYWNESFANILESWGEDNVWNEIQLLTINLTGNILDIACGTGIVITKLQKNKNLDLFGLDISDLLIRRAISKGIPSSHLATCDATRTEYKDNFFDYSYSIGSLEHFTVDGIERFISECARYTRLGSFHMIPVSRSGKDEGWMKTAQSFHNNSIEWWQKKFLGYFNTVTIINSSWDDKISLGKWVICQDKKQFN